MMRVLILNTDYPAFLSQLYAQNLGMEQLSYVEQMRIRMATDFGVADFYSRNLNLLGHTALDIHANNMFMQRAWAKEHGLSVSVEVPNDISSSAPNIVRRLKSLAAKTPLRSLKHLLPSRTASNEAEWFYPILEAQIETYQPDIILNQEMYGISVDFLRRIKTSQRIIVGQHAATSLPSSWDYSVYDLLISSFPPTVDFFRDHGRHAELQKLGFEASLVKEFESEKTYELTFVGSLQTVHSSRRELLEAIAAHFPQFKIWGPETEIVKSPLASHYQGEAWGREMYKILAASRMTLNHHGNVLPFANNLRLYEATGMGALLITDAKPNLKTLFDIDREIIAYDDTHSCIEQVDYYLSHDEELEAIASTGQRRTLSEHTWYQRMKEFVELVEQLG